AVEEQLPAGLLLLIRERVVAVACGRRGAENGRQGSESEDKQHRSSRIQESTYTLRSAGGGVDDDLAGCLGVGLVALRFSFNFCPESGGHCLGFLGKESC